jgi:hypothetical protein
MSAQLPLSWTEVRPSGQMPPNCLTGASLIGISADAYLLIGGICGRRQNTIYLLKRDVPGGILLGSAVGSAVGGGSGVSGSGTGSGSGSEDEDPNKREGRKTTAKTWSWRDMTAFTAGDGIPAINNHCMFICDERVGKKGPQWPEWDEDVSGNNSRLGKTSASVAAIPKMIRIFCFGGEPSALQQTSDSWLLDVDTEIILNGVSTGNFQKGALFWRKLFFGEEKPPSRDSAVGWSLGGELYIHGGCTSMTTAKESEPGNKQMPSRPSQGCFGDLWKLNIERVNLDALGLGQARGGESEHRASKLGFLNLGQARGGERDIMIILRVQYFT